MEALWWDRPFTLDGVDIAASVATLHLISSYGARQNIRIHTDDGGWVDRFDLETQPPPINSWHDVDAVLSKTGARYSYQVAKVDEGQCHPVAGTNTDESLPLASIFKLYVLHALAGAIRSGTVSWDDQLTVTDKSKAVGSSGLALPPGAHVSVRTAAEKMIATSDNMATDLLIGRLGTARHRGGPCHGGPSRSGQHDTVPHDVRIVLRRLGSTGSARASGSRRRPASPCSAAAAGEFHSLRT